MASSQFENVYTTATETNFKDILHSTPQQIGSAMRGGPPLDYDQLPEPIDRGSDRSEDLSIELGRGEKRQASRNFDDASSNGIFSFGNDHSQYEITATPPIPPRNNQRKTDGSLRKEASVRRATDSVRVKDTRRTTATRAKPRAVSDNRARLEVEDDSPDHSLPTATFAVRGTRFTATRHISRNYSDLPSRYNASEGLNHTIQTPARPATGNAAAQTTNTGNQSFAFPDIANLTDLVVGPRSDTITPFKRTGASGTRFTSVSYKPQVQQHIPIHSISVPEDEKAIFASLRMANDQLNQLKLEKSETEKRLEAAEGEMLAMRVQTDAALRNPGGASGVRGESIEDERVRLQTTIKSLQSHIDKTERAASNSDIKVTRLAKERDVLFARLGKAEYENEELSRSNGELRTEVARLERENAELYEDLARQTDFTEQTGDTNPSTRFRSKGRNRGGSTVQDDDFVEGTTANRSKRRARSQSRNGDDNTSGSTRNTVGENAESKEQSDAAFVSDMAARIGEEVQKHRDEAAAKAQVAQQPRRSNSARSRSGSQNRKGDAQRSRYPPRRYASAPTKVDADVEPSGALNDEEDLTQLTAMDTTEVEQMRKKIELEHMRSRHQRKSAAASAYEAPEPTATSSRQTVPRKSSLRDITNVLKDDTGRFSVRGGTVDNLSRMPKTVRVQSPHSSQDILEPAQESLDTGEASMLSNTSRRRRRTCSMEGMTSAFIIPDITMHSQQDLRKDAGSNCAQHQAANCTICASNRKEEVDIPRPVPVTDREELADATDATIRPVQTPADALASVIKALEDEIKHLKISREAQNRLYNQHDPAISRGKRQSIKLHMDKLTNEIERRSDQVYQLYDVLEGQKKHGIQLDEQEVEETLTSIGFDPAELSGRQGRSAPAGLDDGRLSDEESDELPWEGLSDDGSGEEAR